MSFDKNWESSSKKKEIRMGNRETAIPYQRPCSRTRILGTVFPKTTRVKVSEVKKRFSSVLNCNLSARVRSDEKISRTSAGCLVSRHGVSVGKFSSSNP